MTLCRLYPRALLLLLATLCTGAHLSASDAANTAFITRRGDRLYEGDTEFRYISVNQPDVLQIISNYQFDGEFASTRLRLPNEYEQRDAIRTVRQLGGRVVRTFVITHTNTGSPYAMFDVGSGSVIAHEPALVALDRLLLIAREEGVRLMIPLIAYKSAIRGDPSTYGPDFWNVGSADNLRFKAMLTQLLGRTNRLTGIPYRDDPTIFGWQTGNELVIGDDPARQAWLHDIAAFIKPLAPHHLLIDGRNKPDDVYDRYAAFATDPNLDAVSYHTYVNLPQANTPAGTLRLIRDQLRGRIPLIVSEVAMYTSVAQLRALCDEIIADGTVGANWWGLRFHNRDGGFYKHSDRGSKYEALNWPGFTDPRGNLPEVAHEREVLGLLHDYAARITGTAPVHSTIPDAPLMLPAPDPGHLAWQGSTGASAYELQRAAAATGPWTTLVSGLGDHLATFTSLFCDETARVGDTYYYRVIASNAAGASPASAPFGPLQPDRVWLVDDLLDDSRLDPASANLNPVKAYANDAHLGDVAVVQRQDAAQPGYLAYRIPGALQNMSLTAFETQTPLRFSLTDATGKVLPLTPVATAYAEGRRTRYTFTATAALPPGVLTIELTAPAPADQAVGRVELAWIP